MQQALLEAKKAYSEDEVPIGCVIVKDGEIIAFSHNEKEARQDVTAHAEILAIKRAQAQLKTWHLEECTLYVTLEPCMMCTGAIVHGRIKKVVYGTDDPKGGALVSNIDLNSVRGLNHYPQIVGDVLKEECSQILKDYFKDKRVKKKAV